VIDFMTEEAKRLGRANGGGFYEYPETGKKYLWPELKKHFPVSESALTQEEMIDRIRFAQAVETIRCYEEGVLTSVADANIGSIFGWGFAPFKGGTLQFVNDYGVKEFLVRTKELSELYGNRFSPPKLLVDMADQGKSFS
jgi:3-hydroxyacyl-CoA dehydrogenase/enoyl-CoA hydratase/3-hydroxybutyryl-CoA epimerase